MASGPTRNRTKGDFTERLRRWWEHLLKWGEVTVVVAVLVCYLLLVSGLISDWHLLVGLAAVAGGGLVALVLKTRRAVDELGDRVDRLIEDESWELKPLWRCQELLEERLTSFGAKQRVVVHHLGLDMGQAWEKVSSLLKGCTNLKRVELKFLLLTDDFGRLGAFAPEDVKIWCDQVPLSLMKMKSTFRELEEQCVERGAEVQVEVRQYSEVPTIHGFALVQPEEVRYFSFCRWEGRAGETFGWAPERYREIVGPQVDPSLKDVIDIFDGAFRHLWHASKDQVAFKAVFKG